MRVVFVIILLMFTSVEASPLAVQAEQAEESVMKAVAIEKLSRYIQWPKEILMKNSNTPFVIGVFGETKFSALLMDIYRDKTIKGKPVEIHNFSKVNQISNCHVLYILKEAKEKLKDIIKFTRNKPILTMSDTPGFAQMGVLVNIIIQKKKICFEINETGVHQSGIKVSALIMRLARIVHPLSAY